MPKMTRPRLAYEGRTRGRVNRKTGELEHRSQRQFSRPALALEWTMVDQFTAVDRGYFLERVEPLNVVRVVPIRLDRTDMDICNELERLTFAGDDHARKAVLFIEQQDKHGWSGAWAKPVIETLKPSLRWYKMRKQVQQVRRMAVREHYKAIANKRWAKNQLLLT